MGALRLRDRGRAAAEPGGVDPAGTAGGADAPAPAPKAFEIPSDLQLGEIEPLPEPPPSTLADADGFETIDED